MLRAWKAQPGVAHVALVDHRCCRLAVSALAVSFDPARDDVATLRGYAEKCKLDPRIWALARAELAQVR